MKIGILSDTHDNLKTLEAALGLFREEKVSFIIHAGDWVSPFAVARLTREEIPYIGVFGNNDGDRLMLHQVSGGRIHRPGILVEKEGLKVLVLHEPDNVDALAASGHFGLIVHGHDHLPRITLMGATLVVNPGECGGWLSGRPSVAILDTASRLAEIHPLPFL